ncbi:hypothetical protein SteCoe_19972 [Stentor coeruleus]|uniref:PCI domain-containing protein n=1 Tax=Stentor coeruleus TaxID=5963 RepID=A0A1R2BSV9_9CILI|nr:hypothetical protein SteCoe_19972 [Stentor coeruleus]
MDYKRWTHEILKSFVNFEESQVKKLLFQVKINEVPPNQALRIEVEKILTNDFQVTDGDSELWVNFLSEHLDAKSRKHQIFRHMNQAYQAFVKIYKEDDEGYKYYPLIKDYSSRLLKEGTKASNIKEVINSYRILLSACQCHKPLPYSQVLGLIFAINISCKACFRLNNLQQLTSLLRIINNENSKFPKLNKYPMAQQVEFKFYEGKFYLYENNLDMAYESLVYAFEKSYKDSLRNKKVILKYLIPLRILHGKYPTRELLDKYELQEYIRVIDAIKNGQVKDMEKILEINQVKYIRNGVLLVMDLIKLLCYRNFFRRVYKIVKRNILTFEVIKRALIVAGVQDVDDCRVFAIFNGLICYKWMRGQVNMMTKTVVFREQNTFPSVN